MSERKYSISEIDLMRKYIGCSYPAGVNYLPHERTAEIEQRLRTYMQNGTTPEELEKHAQDCMEEDRKWREHTTRLTAQHPRG